jgi:16S rRNA processing protein RimM
VAELVALGRVGAAHGVRGWVKVWSDTEPSDNILEYERWLLRGADGSVRELALLEGRRQGKSLIARLEGIESPEQARSLCHAQICVPAQALPELGPGEYYWHQLEGLEVWCESESGASVLLGRVREMMETGANDVVVVAPCEGSLDQRERLLPWLPDRVVRQVDLESGRLLVDWEPAF